MGNGFFAERHMKIKFYQDSETQYCISVPSTLPGGHVEPDGREEHHAVEHGGAGEEAFLQLVGDDFLPVATTLNLRVEIHFVLEQRPVHLRRNNLNDQCSGPRTKQNRHVEHMFYNSRDKQDYFPLKIVVLPTASF